MYVRDVESAAAVAANSTQPKEFDQGAEQKADNLINLDALIEAIRRASSQLEVRLHLRDWTWKLPRAVIRSRSLLAQRVANKSGVSVPFADGEETSGQVAAGVGPLLGSKFSWHFEWARRNDIKVNPDTYGFVLTGQAIDASYRVYNELYLISANHLIAINYTNSSETVTSVRPIGDEFPGLSSSLLDPITGAYYDRYANQIYFFKGDRYVGYDYATKQPLEDFLLPPAIELLTGTGASPSLMLQIAANSDRQFATPLLLGKTNQQQQQQPPPQQKLLVSSLPVVSILGRQHYVDAIYHDLHDDHVYIFSGMKFYTFQAGDFKDGAFKSARQPALHCINEHFLDGCRFDEAYSNPCISESDQGKEGDAEDDDDDDDDNINHNNESDSLSVNRTPSSGDKFSKLVIAQNGAGGTAANSSLDLARERQKMSELAMDLQKELNFSDEQQLKLRSIAARGGGRLDYLLESTLMGHGAAARAAVKPFVAGQDNSAVGSAAAQPTQSDVHERIVIYLLVAMVLITILVTVAMIFVIVNWTAATRTQQREAALSEQGDELKSANPDQINNSSQAAQAAVAAAAAAYQPAISQYLSNQYYYRQHQPTIGSHYHQARHHHQAGGYLSGGGVPHYHQPRTDFARRSSQPPLPPPPPPQSQLFDALAHQASQMSKSTNGGRSTSSRFDDNILDSSAL